jgi:hypothetical protein
VGWKIVIEYNQKHNKMEDVGMHRKQMTTATTTATRPTGEKRWVVAKSVCASIKYREKKKKRKLRVALGARRKEAKKGSTET